MLLSFCRIYTILYTHKKHEYEKSVQPKVFKQGEGSADRVGGWRENQCA